MVVIGLGSPFLTDDSVGPQVVRLLARRGLDPARLVEAHAGGLLLLEELDGENGAVIVDALVDPRRTPGEVVIADLVSATRNASCSHDCSLAEALAMGRTLGLALPPDGAIHLVGIVAFDVTTFGETPTPAVFAALGPACDAVISLLLAGDTTRSAEYT